MPNPLDTTTTMKWGMVWNGTSTKSINATLLNNGSNDYYGDDDINGAAVNGSGTVAGYMSWFNPADFSYTYKAMYAKRNGDGSYPAPTVLTSTAGSGSNLPVIGTKTWMFTAAVGINDNGVIVGAATSNANTSATNNNGGMLFGLGENDLRLYFPGQWSSNGTGTTGNVVSRAVMWEPTTDGTAYNNAIDLNARIKPGTSAAGGGYQVMNVSRYMCLNAAQGINNNGQIIAYGWATPQAGGTTNGYHHAFVLTPALPGDANLDGSADNVDLGVILANYDFAVTDIDHGGLAANSHAVGGWMFGDFNNDDVCDNSDLGDLLAHYDHVIWPASVVNGGNLDAQAVAMLNAHGITVTPEPSTLALLAIGIAGLLAYAWRKRK
jgi:hypothetical protein